MNEAKKPMIHAMADAMRAFVNLIGQREQELGSVSDEMAECRAGAQAALAEYDAWKAGNDDWRKTVEPTVTMSRFGGIDEQKITHPAFATISANRLSGCADLFGSYVAHQHYIVLRVHPATMTRDGYSERIQGGIDTFIEVAMSEAQWAAMIGSMNHGTGVPCTLQRLSDPGQWSRGIPRLPPQESAAERMESQILDMVARSQERAEHAMEALRPIIAKLSKKDQASMQSVIDSLAGENKSNLKFQHKCLTETQEKLVSEAKVEIDAMVQHVASRFGVASVEQLGKLLTADPHAAVALLAAPKAGEP